MCKVIYYNGTIYTVDGEGWDTAPQEAVAVDENGKIIAVGTDTEVKKLAEPVTEMIDLQGKAVLPGFIDSHVHMPGTAYADLFQINLFGIQNKEDTLAAVKDFIDGHPDEKAYFGTGFNMGIVDENGERPCAKWLDALCSDKPVVLRSYDMHSSWLNSCAMKMNNITAETDPPALGHIHKDSYGEPTGLLTDCPSLNRVSAEYTHEQQLEAVKYFIHKMNLWGYTSISSVAPHMGIDPMIYKEIELAGALSMRINAAWFIPANRAEEGLSALCSLRKNLDTELIKVRTAKYLIDGVLEGNTAYLKEPYDEKAGLGKNYNSFPEWKLTQLKDSFRDAMNQGFQLHLHSIGDAATSMVLDAQELAAKEMEGVEAVKRLRNVITHLQLVSPEDFARMAALNNIAAIQTFWHLKEPGFFETVDFPALGAERIKREYPAKSFVKAGVTVTNSGDYPVSPENNPFYGIKAGVIRNIYHEESFGVKIDDPDDQRFLLNRQERLTVSEMIEAYTINGAYQMFREDEIGSLTPGKWADFIILDRDPVRADVMELDRVKVEQTIFQGEAVSRATN